MEKYINEFKYYVYGDLRLSDNTWFSYESDIKQYITYLDKKNIHDPNDITTTIIRNYLKTLKNRNIAASSQHRKLSAIRLFHKFLHLENLAKEDVSKDIDSPKQIKHIPVCLSMEEIDILFKVLNTDNVRETRDKAMIIFAYSTGLRVSELVNIKLSDLHLDMQYVQVYGKGNKERIVPIGEQAIDILNYYMTNSRPKLIKKHTDMLFLNARNGNSITRQGFFLILKKKAQDAGIKKRISPHILRHSYASHLLKNGVDLRLIQELLGHEDISTTEHYIHIKNDDLNQTYIRFHPRSQMERRKK
ncbi:MAG: tyrosine recombinase [Bacilli bacterium]